MRDVLGTGLFKYRNISLSNKSFNWDFVTDEAFRVNQGFFFTSL